jgi:hypothetical protein
MSRCCKNEWFCISEEALKEVKPLVVHKLFFISGGIHVMTSDGVADTGM